MYTTDHDFSKVIDQYNPMIYHLIHRLNIRDKEGEFYQIGLDALYETYRKYNDRDTFGKLAYITIKSRLIDEVRKRSRVIENEVVWDDIYDYSYTPSEFEHFDPYLWQSIRNHLKDHEWTYVQKRFIESKTIKMIAQEECTNIDTVKGWSRGVKKKLKTLLVNYR
ncbi:sigma-70 family RNA polymerase sigma factor [Aquisalibacillus elongatus]|uniref:RNA polymerase sigma factor (Sigma-70 family) n=1 Tax=Aquisalibacillus elongatus TaxID=485577 RepID=A0A3N5B9S5_9BACI|nr:sigma-70 family RNA polymerase sigma factor [Aquisalibacillus elongatus]RPF54224.1 RNA polymerase sigma factor (sigma-70 family) [Aquisalibacillus elongatus]